MSASTVIDQQAIESLRALNPGDNDEFLREITQIFLEDTPRRMAELDESLVASDIAKFTRAAHSIKGSSANMGAAALKSAAEKLEHEARTRGLTAIGSLVDQVKSEFARAQTELSELVKQNSPTV